MRAVLVRQPGDASQLYIGECPTPTPKDTQILVKVKCFCLNRMDINQRQGAYPPPPGASEILGVEVSGIVESVGQSVTKFQPGDAVFGLMGGGGYAEYAVMEQELAMPKPDALSFQQAAAIPETWFTAYQALFFVLGLKAGEDILIHAGASGVGIAAIQLAKQAGANRIFVTAGSDEKTKFCESLGATRGINYKTEDWAAVIAQETANKGVNATVDFVGKDYFDKNIATLAIDGRMVLLAFLSGAVLDGVNIAPLLKKRLRVEGSALRSRSLEYQTRLRDAIYKHVVEEHFAKPSESYKLFIDKEFDWKDIAEAHRTMESNQTMGKLVVKVT
ncbi:NADPH:quinone reductase-like protein [Zychaea mexicana]|uniref:NADPH:quinone reductase-like protein n=1 Tax=Zychaea mexicana TaxID=64656 RepID=UPI0022FEC49B|nr:NADPH:quinone reductase-like protein [Zychaea mexicana]KAI9498268.1 NADPH:quinone reductase-like protein [Zychaea mexicana]